MKLCIKIEDIYINIKKGFLFSKILITAMRQYKVLANVQVFCMLCDE